MSHYQLKASSLTGLVGRQSEETLKLFGVLATTGLIMLGRTVDQTNVLPP